MSTTSITEHHHHNKRIKCILIIFLIVFSVLFVTQWLTLYNNIKEIKKNTEIDNLSLKNVKTNLIDISTLKSDSLNVTLAKEDIEKINSNLDALASEIYNEKNRAESIIDKDIDRLNLYMALGIGFIAILGVFVPILVNILTNDDLKRKQEILTNDLKSTKDDINKTKKESNLIKDKVDKIDINAIDSAVEKSKEIDGLKEKTEKVLPKLSIITLQIAIHRLFNVSSLALSKIAKNPNDSSLFIELFSDVKNAIQLCKSDLIIIEKTIVLKQTLKDCSELMMEEDYRFTTFGTSRNLYVDIELLSAHLKELSLCNKDNQDAKYSQLDQSFESFLKKLKSSNAQNQPTA
ncbi:hypothetical protein [Elizabethkingia anophelis]|uniref:hypothetical protein n=1 Tax=Elizabethkingia anophelis TaxID=1117645 RepID=UPI0016246F15|nr:hypothetical protein [Elizabethkingia anophelis]MCT4322287.1 hypothetical protein [Elizabethkingia anophelis]HAY3535351.1 hypothetical protein [Elizabethkingia anophelis]HAY3537361.1 hypothetical protein [Elizabethkingia anophelis]HAY3547467.1 hypothetical protein [Elizabethkingia anophelis]HAY3549275.1 hypothetical protein [Elizabethkingia anophelis]